MQFHSQSMNQHSNTNKGAKVSVFIVILTIIITTSVSSFSRISVAESSEVANDQLTNNATDPTRNHGQYSAVVGKYVHLLFTTLLLDGKFETLFCLWTPYVCVSRVSQQQLLIKTKISPSSDKKSTVKLIDNW